MSFNVSSRKANVNALHLAIRGYRGEKSGNIFHMVQYVLGFVIIVSTVINGFYFNWFISIYILVGSRSSSSSFIVATIWSDWVTSIVYNFIAHAKYLNIE